MRALAAALTAVILALAGCGGDEDTAPLPEAQPEATTTTPPPTTEPEEEEQEAEPDSVALGLERVATGLESPVHVAAAPGEPGRLYVVEQRGTIRVVENGRVREQPFLDVSDRVRSGGEQGLLSITFHPDYGDNGRFFVDFTNAEGDTRVVEYRGSGGGAPVDPASGREILAVDQPYSNHNGGQLAFGPDGLLYVGLGDGGAGGDPENRAQDLSERLGKLLRRDVDDPDADWEIAAYGLRNPWRFSFDRETGDLYLADVGQNAQEEVNYLPRSRRGLVNFGWDVFEGRLRYEDKEPNPAGRLVEPVAVYGRDGGCSVTGGFVYRGETIPSADGRYFYGDYCSGTIWSLRISGDSATAQRRERFTVDTLTSFGEDENGEVYLVSHAGAIYRLAPA